MTERQTGATPDQIEAAHVRSWTWKIPGLPMPEMDDEQRKEEMDEMTLIASWLVPVGMVIVPESDVLTPEMRADIKFVVECLKSICEDTESPFYLTPENVEIAKRVEQIAGGAA